MFIVNALYAICNKYLRSASFTYILVLMIYELEIGPK